MVLCHPMNHNIQSHDVLSLLKRIGTVTEKRDGRYSVMLGCEAQTFDAPRHHDVDEQQVLDPRRILKGAGLFREST